MRWRVAALMALSGMAAAPAGSDAMAPAQAAMLSVSVAPHAGTATSHFTVRFRAAVTTGRSARHEYRITASSGTRSGCQSNAAVVPAATKAGATVHGVLKPGEPGGWCLGTFRGQVWDVVTQPCPIGEACPAVEPLPHLVGRFTFHVTRG
ncbi:MAG: hypothetical protein JO130_19490 [Solirubrobacterales bacterium]|nr:hypothetical protein [Solirubrobacterales bacterium]